MKMVFLLSRWYNLLSFLKNKTTLGLKSLYQIAIREVKT